MEPMYKAKSKANLKIRMHFPNSSRACVVLVYTEYKAGLHPLAWTQILGKVVGKEEERYSLHLAIP
jgi:hypothetical protein